MKGAWQIALYLERLESSATALSFLEQRAVITAQAKMSCTGIGNVLHAQVQDALLAAATRSTTCFTRLDCSPFLLDWEATRRMYISIHAAVQDAVLSAATQSGKHFARLEPSLLFKEGRATRRAAAAVEKQYRLIAAAAPAPAATAAAGANSDLRMRALFLFQARSCHRPFGPSSADAAALTALREAAACVT